MLSDLLRSASVILFCATASQAAIIGVVEKLVNPGAQTGIYAGFSRNTTTNPAGPFVIDTQLNSGTLADTWVSYALGVKATLGEDPISGLQVSISVPVSSTTGLHQRWNYNPT